MSSPCLRILTVLAFWLCTAGSLAAQPSGQHITMEIPEQLIETALARTLPLTFESDSDRLEGTVTVVSISNLRLSDKTVLCHLELQGKDLTLISTVANQLLRLKLGDASIDFDSQTTLRYDPQRNILFIRPVAQDVDPEQTLEGGDIGQALLLLLNGQEFPLELQDIEPIIAEASNKTVTIAPRIADINAVAGAVRITLSTSVTSTAK